MMAFRTIFAVAAALATAGNLAAAQECRTKQDYTIVGHDHGAKIPVGSATLCCTLCAVVPACRAAVYSKGYCQRKTAGESHMSPQAGSIVLLPIPTTTTTTLAPTTPEPTPPPFPPLSRVWLNSGINGYNFGGPVYMPRNRVGYTCAGGGCYTQTWVLEVDNNGTVNGTTPYEVAYSRGDMLYAMAPGNNVTRLNPDSLQPIWESTFLDIQTVGSRYSAANEVFVTNSCPNPNQCESTVVFNNTNGAVLWSREWTLLLCSSDSIVVTTSNFYPAYPNNTVTARDILSGTPLFTIPSQVIQSNRNSKMTEERIFLQTTNNYGVVVYSAFNGSFLASVQGVDASIGFANDDDADGFFIIGWANSTAVTWEGDVMWSVVGNSQLTLDKANPRIVYGLVQGNLTAYDRRTGGILAQSTVNGKRYSWTQAMGVENGVVLSGQKNTQTFGPTASALYRIAPDGTFVSVPRP